MLELRKELAAVITRKNVDWRVSDLSQLADDTDIFDAIDSFAALDLLLETEAAIETITGRYVAIGDEKIFDAQKSPLRRFSLWVDHVSNAIAKRAGDG